MKKQLVASLGLIGCVALAEDVQQSRQPASSNAVPIASSVPAKATDSYPVIGYLEKRDCVITIKSSTQGTIYSVADKQGKLLHENVSAEQLKAQAPEIYEVIKTGTANDASLNVSALR